MEDRTKAVADIHAVQDRIRQAAIDLQPNLKDRMTARESAALLKPRKGVQMLVPAGIRLIERKPFLLADGRTPEDVRETQVTLEALGILMQVLGPLTEQVVDSIRQYEADLYKTVLNAYAAANRVQGDAEVALFAKEMKRQLAVGPRSTKTALAPAVDSTESAES